MERPGRDRHHALLVPLAPDHHTPLHEVEVAHRQPGQLLPPQPAPVPERDERGVPPSFVAYDRRLTLPRRGGAETRLDERPELGPRKGAPGRLARPLPFDRAHGRGAVVVVGLHESELPRFAEHAAQRGEHLVYRRVLVALGERGANRLRVLGPEPLPGEGLGLRRRVRLRHADRRDRGERPAHGAPAPRRETGEVDRGGVRSAPALDVDGEASGSRGEGCGVEGHFMVSVIAQSNYLKTEAEQDDTRRPRQHFVKERRRPAASRRLIYND